MSTEGALNAATTRTRSPGLQQSYTALICIHGTVRVLFIVRWPRSLQGRDIGGWLESLFDVVAQVVSVPVSSRRDAPVHRVISGLDFIIGRVPVSVPRDAPLRKAISGLDFMFVWENPCVVIVLVHGTPLDQRMMTELSDTIPPQGTEWSLERRLPHFGGAV